MSALYANHGPAWQVILILYLDLHVQMSPFPKFSEAEFKFADLHSLPINLLLSVRIFSDRKICDDQHNEHCTIKVLVK